ncbi:MAG: hypothetical protein IKN57_08025 [Parasporobacterium sp.]|nr:hypothetical protein [Parasporobacterium sp.]
MSRTMMRARLNNKSVDEAISVFEAMMAANGYRHIEYKGEEMWSSGDPVLSGMRCFTYMFEENTMVIQGWIKDVLGIESDLNGFAGMLPKKKMKKILESIIMRID